MMPASNPTPREFGQALRTAREEAGVPLELIAEQTKISKRLLEALEAGDFKQLPGGVFPRLFVRQIMQFLRQDPEPWVRSFAAAQEHLTETSAQIPVVATPVTRDVRLGPWLVGSLIVAAALVAVIMLQHRQEGAGSAASAPTPQTVLSVLPPTPPPTPEPTPEVPVPQQPTAEQQGSEGEASPEAQPTAGAAESRPPAPRPEDLVVRAVARPCWAQARLANGQVVSQLVQVGQAWVVPVGGGSVELTLGDAGAAEIDYLGRHLTKVGADGTVGHVRLGPGQTAAPGQ